MKITWHGHSCFELSSSMGSVLFDPYGMNSVPGLTLPQICVDMVLSSHGHADHNAVNSVGRTGLEPECRTEQLGCWHDDEQGAKRGMNVINIVTMEGVRVAHLGDVGHMLPDTTVKALGAVDVLMIPVGGYYTIDAPTAKALADRIGARVTVPMHYRGEGFGFDVLGTVDEFAALCGDVVRLEGNTLEVKRGEEKKTVIFKLVK